MPPRRAPTAPVTDNADINQMAYAMHTMAAAVTAQSHAKAQRDLEKREREILAVESRLLSISTTKLLQSLMRREVRKLLIYGSNLWRGYSGQFIVQKERRWS
ncbi:hypothetical protein P8452_47426 [Trifolium repens]|nr:hypothetical protein P8452_47426 [Trifolium repens]